VSVARRHIIISGGSRGLGQTLVKGLLDDGYAVSTCSRKATDFTQRQASNPAFYFATADVSDAEQTDGFVQQAVEKLGRPYGLINCAGIARDGVLATMPESQLDQLLSINLAGTLRLTRRVIRSMLLEPDEAVILNISSIIGLRGYRGLSAYAATKAGMDGITRSLARELGGRHIRVNSIAPGYLTTEMTHGLDDQQQQQIVKRTPLGRLGTPEDVLGPVLFLLSDAGRFITGQVLVVDGGITC
jgi:3-oxoacyl-[acyl-carrier protein] reductase